MSNIGNGILGAVQNQAAAKGKAGHGKVIGGASKGTDFANTVASFSGREGDAGRKGGRLSISGSAEAKQAVATDPKRTVLAESKQTGEIERADGTQPKAAHHEAHSISAALRKADPEAPGKEVTTFAEKAAALLDAASRPGRKAQADESTSDVRDPDEPASDEAEITTGTKEDVAAGTDVGNLLALLAAANASPQATANGTQVAAAAAGGVAQVRGEAGAKSSEKADPRADVAAKADAALVPDADADAVDLPRSDADQAFRLVRADGKGREIDMSISGNGDRATFRDASPTGPKGETVTVVDTRRYIGLAQTGNSAAVTTAIVQDPEWARSLGSTGGLTHAEAAATGKVVNTLKIQMHPIELGLVTATLRLHGDELSVTLQVQTGEAYRQLSEDQDAIVKALRDQGFGVDQVSVQLSPADRSSGTQQGDGQNQQQFSSQPQAREGGNSRQGGGEQAARNFGREEMSHEGTMSENAPGLADGQSQRSGSVYL